jgi:hypothetical protein
MLAVAGHEGGPVGLKTCERVQAELVLT